MARYLNTLIHAQGDTGRSKGESHWLHRTYFQGALVQLGGHSKFLGLRLPMRSVYKYPDSVVVTDPMFPNNPDPFLVLWCAQFPNLDMHAHTSVGSCLIE